jgi:hypothetical protein
MKDIHSIRQRPIVPPILTSFIRNGNLSRLFNPSLARDVLITCIIPAVIEGDHITIHIIIRIRPVIVVSAACGAATLPREVVACRGVCVVP